MNFIKAKINDVLSVFLSHLQGTIFFVLVFCILWRLAIASREEMDLRSGCDFNRSIGTGYILLNKAASGARRNDWSV